nr:predicted periplasmic or secreted lipoprotein [uncultured Gammaproteobacteria bacterium]
MPPHIPLNFPSNKLNTEYKMTIQTTRFTTLLGLSLSLCAALLLSACAAPVLVAGAAGGATVASDQRSNQALLDDQLIEAKAKDAIYDDPTRAKRIHVNVTSYNYVVLLTGEALSAETRDKVVDIVRHLDKVRRVHNEIRVADLTDFASRTRDTWITSKVKSQMIATRDFPSSRIKVVTENGSVYLMGLVTKELGNQAAAITSKVDGVQRVIKLFEYI